MRTFSSHFIPQQQDVLLHRPEEEEEKPRCEWDISLISTLVSSSSSPNSGASDALGVIEFDPTNRVIATGGIARKIRVYSVASLPAAAAEDPNEGDQRSGDDGAGDAYDYLICTPAKLSSLRWRPGSGGRVIGSGDYDGVVTEYDLERRVPVFERDEHGGRRVWSLDYSHSDPSLAASGSDDGTMQMWDPRAEKCVATVQPSPARRPVCCVEFSPSSHLVGVGCADRNAYAYDVRRVSEPVVVLEGHGKTVSYVRFVEGKKMVSAGIDGCLKLWDLDKAGGPEIRTYRGHVNSRSFVGLSAWKEGGLVGCGSENNKVVVYDMRWGEPVWVHGFQPQMGGFVSSVCWAQVDDRTLLLAGGSIGDLKVFTAIPARKIGSPHST